MLFEHILFLRAWGDFCRENRGAAPVVSITEILNFFYIILVIGFWVFPIYRDFEISRHNLGNRFFRFFPFTEIFEEKRVFLVISDRLARLGTSDYREKNNYSHFLGNH